MYIGKSTADFVYILNPKWRNAFWSKLYRGESLSLKPQGLKDCRCQMGRAIGMCSVGTGWITARRLGKAHM